MTTDTNNTEAAPLPVCPICGKRISEGHEVTKKGSCNRADCNDKIESMKKDLEFAKTRANAKKLTGTYSFPHGNHYDDMTIANNWFFMLCHPFLPMPVLKRLQKRFSVLECLKSCGWAGVLTVGIDPGLLIVIRERAGQLLFEQAGTDKLKYRDGFIVAPASVFACILECVNVSKECRDMVRRSPSLCSLMHLPKDALHGDLGAVGKILENNPAIDKDKKDYHTRGERARKNKKIIDDGKSAL
jgi:hypothetical protein